MSFSVIVPLTLALALGAVTARVCGDLAASWLGGSSLMDMVPPYEETQSCRISCELTTTSQAGNFKA